MFFTIIEGSSPKHHQNRTDGVAIFDDAFNDLEDSYSEDTPNVLSPLDLLSVEELTDRKNYKSKYSTDAVDEENTRDEERLRNKLDFRQRVRYDKSEYAGRV